MKYRLTPWLLTFFAIFLARETVFASPHTIHESMVAPEAGYTTQPLLIASADTTHSPVAVTTSFSGQDTSRSMGHAVQPVSGSLTTPKADAAPVYDPASLFFLGIALFGLAGICRKRLEAKKVH